VLNDRLNSRSQIIVAFNRHQRLRLWADDVKRRYGLGFIDCDAEPTVEVRLSRTNFQQTKVQSGGTSNDPALR
jgi:hypothetical protein